MQTSVVILGAGGDGLVIREAARCAAAAGEPIAIVGFLDDSHAKGTNVGGTEVLGRLEDWVALPTDTRFVPALHKARQMPLRAARIEGLRIPAVQWISIRHPLSAVAADVEVGHGCFVASGATVQPGARIGHFASIRAGASVGHDAAVEDHAYVGPNATLCGRTRLRTGAHLGPNAVVLDEKVIGAYAVVGIGAAVTKDVRDYLVVMGNPARRVGVVPRPGGSARAADSAGGGEH